jgi:hypothetical protein
MFKVEIYKQQGLESLRKRYGWWTGVIVGGELSGHGFVEEASFWRLLEDSQCGLERCRGVLLSMHDSVVRMGIAFIT